MSLKGAVPLVHVFPLSHPLPLSPSRFGPEMDDRYKEVEDDIPHEGFTFIGNISLIDPPKPGVPEAVSPLASLPSFASLEYCRPHLYCIPLHTWFGARHTDLHSNPHPPSNTRLTPLSSCGAICFR